MVGGIEFKPLTIRFKSKFKAPATTAKTTRFVLLLAILSCLTLSTSGYPTDIKSLSSYMTMRQAEPQKVFNNFNSFNRRRGRQIRRQQRECRAIRDEQFRTQDGVCTIFAILLKALLRNLSLFSLPRNQLSVTVFVVRLTHCLQCCVR